MKHIKDTRSICPKCLKVIPAEIFVDGEKVYLEKTCNEHGKYKDIYWSSYDQYLRTKRYERFGIKPKTIHHIEKAGCPYDCGLCPNHKNSTILGILDITNRCNAKCPTCFASADREKDYIYEPTIEQIDYMLDSIAGDVKAIQLTGGEPTLRSDLQTIVLHAKQRGIVHIEVNTNGIIMASSDGVEYIKAIESMYGDDSKEKGISTIYLKFNGFDRTTWEVTTGDPDWGSIPLEAFENIKKAYNDMRRSPGVMLVPLVIKGVNDHEIGDIIDFAKKNSYVCRGINFQPVSFTGSMDSEERVKSRYTLPDLQQDIEEQTHGEITANDFFPVSIVSPFPETIWHWKSVGIPSFLCHPHCGYMTALVIEENGDLSPITKYVNVEKFFNIMTKSAYYFRNGNDFKGKAYALKVLTSIKSTGAFRLVSIVKDIADGDWRALGQLLLNMVFIGAMHFMDAYNFDLERAQMCCIHQILPDGSRVPFCTYQTIHRPFMEQKFSVSLEEWKQRSKQFKRSYPLIT